MSKRLFLIVAVALAPAGLILLYNLLSLRADRERELHAEAQRLGQLASLELQRIVSGTESVLEAIVSAPVVQEMDAGTCSAYLARVAARLTQFSALAVIRADGSLLCRDAAPAVEIYIGDRPYFQEAMETGAFVVGTYTEGRISGSPVLPFALPLRDDEGEIVGVAVAVLELSWLGQRLLERDFAENNALTIADRDGVILAREPFPEDFVGTRIPDAFMYLVNAEQPGTLEVTSQDGTQRILGYYPTSTEPTGFYISAGVSTEEAYAAIGRTTMIGLVIALLGFAAAYLLAVLTARRFIARPLDNLVATVSSWRGGDQRVRTGLSPADGELGIVGSAMDQFMDELLANRSRRRLAEQQRELVLRELDHRVKNLLATVQTVARQTFKDWPQGREAVETFQQRLSAMGNAHQLLVRDHWRSATLSEVVTAAIGPFHHANSPFSASGPEVALHAKAAVSFTMALHELCTNAAKYGALSTERGRVSLTWNTASDALKMVWAESGGPPVEPPASKGFGSRMLEMALVHEFGGQVEMDFAPTGVVCTISAPLSAIVAEETAEEPERSVA